MFILWYFFFLTKFYDRLTRYLDFTSDLCKVIFFFFFSKTAGEHHQCPGGFSSSVLMSFSCALCVIVVHSSPVRTSPDSCKLLLF